MGFLEHLWEERPLVKSETKMFILDFSLCFYVILCVLLCFNVYVIIYVFSLFSQWIQEYVNVCWAPEWAALNERKPCKINFITGFSNKNTSPSFLPRGPAGSNFPPHHSPIKSSRIRLKPALRHIWTLFILRYEFIFIFISVRTQRMSENVEQSFLLTH